jgi:transposase
MRTAAIPTVISQEQRQLLERLARGRNTAHKLVLRARIVLGHGNCMSKVAISRMLQTSRPTVDMWLQRFRSGGVDALLRDAPRPGGKPPLAPEKEAQILEWTLQRTPKGQTHWSSRSLAKALGVGSTTVLNVWHKYRLKPHRTETFKLSRDPEFVAKVRDVVGLYLNPPEKALVLSVDEKSQIQALDRTQPILPLRPGIPERQTHDYKRHGTTTLFAALNLLDGTVIGRCLPRHRHTEFLAFLESLEASTPKRQQIHLILDNYGTHKHPRVRQWFADHPRYHLHFTPKGASWMNLVERWFAEITRRRIRRGTFRNVRELEQAIRAYIRENNKQPKPFVWTASAASIIRKVRRCKPTSEAGH